MQDYHKNIRRDSDSDSDRQTNRQGRGRNLIFITHCLNLGVNSDAQAIIKIIKVTSIDKNLPFTIIISLTK